MTKICDLRLSWIWTETFSDLLLKKPKFQSRWGEPGSESSYVLAFNNARAKSGSLTLPWPEDDDYHQHFFWLYYLQNEDPREITAGKAMRWLVPLRESGFVKVRAPGVAHTVRVAAYHYPHCLGLVITTQIKADLVIFDMVRKAFELTRSDTLEVTDPDGSVEQMKIYELGATVLDRLRTGHLWRSGPSWCTLTKAVYRCHSRPGYRRPQ